MNEKVINIESLIFYILLHWRSLILAGIVGAILAGGYSVAGSVGGGMQTANGQPVISDEERAAVDLYADRVRNYEDMQYSLSKSAFMALDAKSVAKTDVLLSVKGAGADRIAEAYRNLVNGSGAVKYICDAEGIESDGINKLIITDTQENNSANVNSVALGGESDTAVVFFEVLGSDETASERMAKYVTEYLNQNQSNIASSIGKHTLAVVSISTATSSDPDIISVQSKYTKNMLDLLNEVSSKKKELSENQKQYFETLKNDISADMAEQDTKDLTEDSKANPEPQISKKYVLAGLMGAVFCMTCLWTAVYIFSNRIKAEDPYERLFGISLMGFIPTDDGKKRVWGFIDKLIVTVRDRNKRRFSVEEAVSIIVSRVKIRSIKDEVSNLVFIGCNLEKNVPDIPTSMVERLKESGVNAAVLDNILYNPENTEKLGAMDGAVIIEKAGRTMYSELADEIELLKKQQIKILGCVIVE